MTLIPIDETPAGSWMDAAVAEALGWLPYESDGIWYWKDMSDDDFPYYNYVASNRNVAGYKLEDVKMWSPSTDIGAAWGLWDGDITVHRIDNRYECFLSPEYGFCMELLLSKAVAEGETLALAISRAFLKVSGVEHVEVLE